MKHRTRSSSRIWLSAGAAGVTLGLVAAAACLGLIERGKAQSLPPEAGPGSGNPANAGTEPGAVVAAASGVDAAQEESAAMRYAKAVQAGDADEMMGRLLWVTERLERVDLDTGEPAARQAAREELVRHLLERNVEGNQLRPEGIDDQYVFVPEAAMEVAGVDEGRDDLERTVRERVWIRVTYASPIRAPLDRNGRAIRSLTVGVNVDEHGRVLKAGIVGNLDIDTKSIEHWGAAPREAGHGT